MKMRAAVLEEFGKPLVLQNVELQDPKAGEALVRIDTLARFVAFETVAAAFKLAMGRAERARRDLPSGRSEKPGGDHQEDKEAAPRWPRVHPPHPRYPVRVATAMCTSMKTYITTAKGLCTTCQ